MSVPTPKEARMRKQAEKYRARQREEAAGKEYINSKFPGWQDSHISAILQCDDLRAEWYQAHVDTMKKVTADVEADASYIIKSNKPLRRAIAKVPYVPTFDPDLRCLNQHNWDQNKMETHMAVLQDAVAKEKNLILMPTIKKVLKMCTDFKSALEMQKNKEIRLRHLHIEAFEWLHSSDFENHSARNLWINPDIIPYLMSLDPNTISLPEQRRLSRFRELYMPAE